MMAKNERANREIMLAVGALEVEVKTLVTRHTTYITHF